MIAATAYTRDGPRAVDDPAAISDAVGHRGTVVWVDLVDPTEDDLRCVQHEFALHPLAMEDAVKHGQRPKLERYPPWSPSAKTDGDPGDGAGAGDGSSDPGDGAGAGETQRRRPGTHAFLVAYSADLVEVDLFAGPGWLVSVRAAGENDEEPFEIEGTRHRFEKATPEEATSGFLLYIILDELVDGYFSQADAIEDRLEELEDKIFLEGTDERVLQRDLYALRRDLVAFRRRVQPLREVLAGLLRKEVEWVDDLTLTHLQDVHDHVLRVIDQIDSHREVMGNAVEAHLALMSNRMNGVMKKMTSWGAILLGSTLVAGIYGMNFQHMPELDWRLGYPFALSIMVVLTVVLYLLFRRRDWM